MAAKKKMLRTTGNGFRAIALRLMVQGGGQIMSDALREQITASGFELVGPDGKDKFNPNLHQMKHEKIINCAKHKPREPYLIRLTNSALMALSDHVGDEAAPEPVNGNGHAALMPVAAAPIAAPTPMSRATRVRGPHVSNANTGQPEVFGTAIHLHGNRVALWVQGTERKFTRDEFSDVADLFSVLLGKRA